MEKCIEPSELSLEVFMQKLPAHAPVVMLNLLKYRESASYPESRNTDIKTGREAYRLYTECVTPTLQSLGARIVWAG